ncbi:MAG TPA: pyridine nucleotide-disulfide oxidoreductase, partial [Reyranella sp.]
YRKRMIDSPAYRLNHEEVVKALEEGIVFAENLNPIEAVPDERGALSAMVFTRERLARQEELKAEGAEQVTLPARTLLVAAGTSPNVTCEKEAPGTFKMDAKKKFFQPHIAVKKDDGGFHVVPDANGFFTSYDSGGRFVTYYGDNHPRYAGNVVKAMASAKDGFRHVTALFAGDTASLDPAAQPARNAAWADLVARMDFELIARVEDVVRLTPTIVEVIVKAPAAARHFHPGQFYRLQNYESAARRVGHTPLLMEGIALTGAWVDKERGLLSLIALELGVSSRLVAYLRKNEPVVVMGPTGAPTEIPDDRHVLLLGGGLGNAVLFSIGQAFRKAGSKVLYFAGYKKPSDRYKVEEIEAAADVVVWACDEAPGFPVDRPQDKTIVANIVEAMRQYAAGELGEQPIPFSAADRIVAIGSDGMMNAVRLARHSVLKPYLKSDHRALGSINSPMQCMMKEICAQCLQLHKDPVTGKESVVFSCFNQDQELDRVDFACLRQRLRQNGVQEKIGALWIDRSLRKIGAR